MKIVVYILFFFTLSSPVLAQSKSDGKFLFKTWLFLEHSNTKSRHATQFSGKDSLLFNLFQKEIEIKIDTLKSSGFSEDYVFLSVNLSGDTLKRNAIKYKDGSLVEYADIPVDNCDGYVLCVNKNRGTSYRIRGFSANDFFGLYQDVQLQNKELTNRRLSIKQFLKNYAVDGLDFWCLYSGLTSADRDFIKYPCLRNCSDVMVIVH